MAGGTETEAEREKRKKAEKKRMEAPKNRSEVTPTRSVQDPRAGLSHHSDDHAKPQGDHYRGHPEAKRGPSGSHPARGVDATESTNDQASSYRDDPARPHSDHYRGHHEAKRGSGGLPTRNIEAYQRQSRDTTRGSHPHGSRRSGSEDYRRASDVSTTGGSRGGVNSGGRRSAGGHDAPRPGESRGEGNSGGRRADTGREAPRPDESQSGGNSGGRQTAGGHDAPRSGGGREGGKNGGHRTDDGHDTPRPGGSPSGRTIVNLESEDNWSDGGTRKEWENGNEPKPADVHCYTDGSKMEQRTGAGCVITQERNTTQISMPTGRYASVYQAELTAIELAVRKLLEDKLKRKKIIIYSDSQASLKALMMTKTKSTQLHNCVQMLNELGMGNSVRLAWVPGHTGIEGNEKADEAAKTAANTTFVGPEPAIPIATAMLKQLVNDRTKETHLNRWRNTAEMRQSKKALQKPITGTELRTVMSLSRKELRWVIGIKTGHCGLNRHLSILGVAESAKCPKCGAQEETPYHYGGDWTAPCTPEYDKKYTENQY